jgi:hypothetical protein
VKFEEAELVMTNDGEFYRAFTSVISTTARHSVVTKAFSRLFPEETVTEKKIQMLRTHYEKEWLAESRQKYPSRSVAIAASIEKRVNVDDDESQSDPQSYVMKINTSGYITGFGEAPVSNVKLIDTVHYVNGIDVRKLSDDQLISIIREREMEIAKLNSTSKKPARLQKRAAELQVELDALVAFLDSLDSTPST